jgi:hypothetical protein
MSIRTYTERWKTIIEVNKVLYIEQEDGQLELSNEDMVTLLDRETVQELIQILTHWLKEGEL